MDTRKKLILSVILITLGIATRLLPHMWNFAPIAAIALCAGVYLGKRYAVVLPIAAMLVGDSLIGVYDWKLMCVVYLGYIITGFMGVLISKHKSTETVFAASLVSALIFFVLTNWAVWQFSPWYERSLAGLLECFALALPFFRGTLLSNIFYTGVLFGGYELAVYWAKRRKYSLAKVARN